MEELYHDFIDTMCSTEVSLGNSVFRLILAMLLGVLVGGERKRKGQIAGIRTFALISMGACLAMLLSIYVPQEYMGLKNGDPGRIAAQVITGVGFLGGGAMIHMRGSVKGLTTAAGIWMTAAIGMAVGVGMYWCSIIATLLILATLVIFEAYEHRLRLGHENRMVKLVINGIVTDITPYRRLLAHDHVHLSTFFIQYDYAADTTSLTLVVLAPSQRDYLPLLDRLRNVADTVSLTLSSQS